MKKRWMMTRIGECSVWSWKVVKSTISDGCGDRRINMAPALALSVDIRGNKRCYAQISGMK